MSFATIDKPNTQFNVVTYTGTGSSNAITVGFQPDFTWIKDRSNARDNQLVNAIVGYPNGTLLSNTTDAEYTAAARVDSRNANGFTVNAPAQVNGSGETYVSWNWKANGAGSSNTSGSISSTVSANTTSGFSIITRTGTGSVGTVGHGLGSTPKMIITKKRSGADNWGVYHSSLGATKYLVLNDTSASGTSSSPFNNTEPTSSVFTVGTGTTWNASGATFVDYCFAEIKGFSKFGSYTGNGSADGTFVYTGFKPTYVMLKNSDGSTNQWLIFDNTREPANIMGDYLQANASNAQETFDGLDFISNGFKMRTANGAFNASSNKYIYATFAENPFVSSKGIPTTAR